MEWDALQTQPHMILEVADVAVCGQLPSSRVDVEAAIGEPSQGRCFVTVVSVLEEDEEIFGEVLDDRDILCANCKAVANGRLDDFWLHLWAILSSQATMPCMDRWLSSWSMSSAEKATAAVSWGCSEGSPGLAIAVLSSGGKL
jgi:hypothetical protein